MFGVFNSFIDGCMNYQWNPSLYVIKNIGEMVKYLYMSNDWDWYSLMWKGNTPVYFLIVSWKDCAKYIYDQLLL